MLAVVLAGCGGLDIPADLRTPSVIGVVEEVTELPDGGETYRLANGQTADVASHKEILLGGEPIVGELLLLGSDPDGGQWVAGVSPSPHANEPGCFWLPGTGRDANDSIETTGGLRLPKATDFDPGLIRDGQYTSPQGHFCLNGNGEVTGYVFA